MPKDEQQSVIAGLYGNALEWYDFLLYASFASIFSDIFFPTREPFISLIAAYSVFAVGFLMRPVGGLLLGHYADHAGRRKSLILSITIMTLATTCIAFLPGFNQIGIMAPLLFAGLRLIQGIAVGGELPGSATYIIEHMFAHRRGFAGSLVLSTAFLGIFAGSLSASILSFVFTNDYLTTWGWRYAYLLGGALGFFGIYLRIKSVESPKFLRLERVDAMPAILVFTQHKISLVLSVLFTSIMALGNYILIAYVTTFLVKSEGMILHDALLINLIALLVLTILIPIAGLLSDYFGRKPIFLSGLIGLLILSFPLFYLLKSGDWYNALMGELLLSVVLAPLNGTVPTIIAEMFPTDVRASGTSIGYNIGQALFGGTAPLVALMLFEATGNKIAPAWYIFGWCILVILVAYKFFRETYQIKLH